MVRLFLQPGKTIPEENKRGLKKQHGILIKPDKTMQFLDYYSNPFQDRPQRSFDSLIIMSSNPAGILGYGLEFYELSTIS